MALILSCLCRHLGRSETTVTGQILDTNLFALSPAIPLAILGYCFDFGPRWLFTLSILGLALLAERVNFVIEHVAHSTGPTGQVRGDLSRDVRFMRDKEMVQEKERPFCFVHWFLWIWFLTVGELLNFTFGNGLEIMIAIFALYNHKTDLVKYYLLGSIISNLVLILGVSLYHGGIIKLTKLKKYGKRQAIVNSYMLLLALLCYLLPIIAFRIHASALCAQPENLSLLLSRAGSITMLIVYFGNLVFQPRKACNQAYEDLDEKRVTGPWSTGIVWLSAMSVLLALLSKYVVDTFEDVSNLWIHVNLLSVLLPTVFNAARHKRAITYAIKNKKLDISLSVALDSATQIFTFMVPMCVTIGWLMDMEMDLNFNLLETGFLTLTIVATTFPLQGWLPSFSLGKDLSGSLSLHSSFSFGYTFKWNLPS